MLSSKITTSFLCSTSLSARCNTSSATLIWFSGNSSKVDAITSPLTERCISVTSSGRSSINSTNNSISGLLVEMLLAISLRSNVFPAFGGATIKPRCPSPTGASTSIIRVDKWVGDVSRTSFVCGYKGVSAGK
ncbi:hypothetical protein D3C73_748740 [compost metagenome]